MKNESLLDILSEWAILAFKGLLWPWIHTVSYPTQGEALEAALDADSKAFAKDFKVLCANLFPPPRMDDVY